jgi:transposase
MSKESTKSYTKEFKFEAVKLVLEKGLSRTQAAKDLGVSVSALAHWVRQFSENGSSSFPGSGKLLPRDEEVRRLEQELRRAEMERDILKKALVYFSDLEKKNMDSSRPKKRTSM